MAVVLLLLLLLLRQGSLTHVRVNPSNTAARGGAHGESHLCSRSSASYTCISIGPPVAHVTGCYGVCLRRWWLADVLPHPLLTTRRRFAGRRRKQQGDVGLVDESHASGTLDA